MTSKERLENLASHALEQAKGDPDAAAKELLPTILKLGLTETLLSAYLETRNGASQGRPDSQRSHDRPDSDPSSSRPSHPLSERQTLPDRPAAPLTRDDGASLTLHESQADIDRSVAPAPKAAPVKLGTAVTRDIVQSANERFLKSKVGEAFVIGRSCLADWERVRSASVVQNYVARQMVALPWKGRGTPLDECPASMIAAARRIWDSRSEGIPASMRIPR